MKKRAEVTPQGHFAGWRTATTLLRRRALLEAGPHVMEGYSGKREENGIFIL